MAEDKEEKQEIVADSKNDEVSNNDASNVEKSEAPKEENLDKKEAKQEEKSNSTKETKSNNKENVEEEKSLVREIVEWIVCIVIAFVLAVFIKYFIFTPTLVQMSSMYPTIFNNERVFVNRLVRTFKLELHHEDIVTFEAPTLQEPEAGTNKAQYREKDGFEWFTYNVLEIGKISYIKRIVGLPGDRIKVVEGKVYLNDILLDESDYLPDGTETYLRDGGVSEEFVVPEGYVFAMGDNRMGSQDCRAFGCIPIEKIEGRVVIRIWPLNKFGQVKKSTITKEQVDEYNTKRK